MNSLQIETRRQEAILIAQKCMNILKEQFGAKEVILFGSLRGDSVWHSESDLDLAVRGMSEKSLWNAYKTLEEIMPNWLKFDLVSVENVPEYLQVRILEKNSMSNNKYLALKTRLQDEIKMLDRILSALMIALDQVATVSEIFANPALSGYIVDFYTVCERLSERVIVELDGELPTGQNWHKLLLRQVGDIGVENRPALWHNSLLLELDEYRRFRHLARHIYQVELNLERILELAGNIPSVAIKIKDDVNVFCDWLEQKSAEKNENPETWFL